MPICNHNCFFMGGCYCIWNSPYGVTVMNKVSVISTPLGYLKLTAHNDALLGCTWVKKSEVSHANSMILKTAATQLKWYFAKKLTRFDIPLAPEGTDFQKKVWDALLQVPYGETGSYQDIANHIGHAKAARAVGNANGKNPLCIFIPCHRVIQASGNIGGYSSGVTYKVELLALESV